MHPAVVWRQKHSQFPARAAPSSNVVGSPLVPSYAAKSSRCCSPSLRFSWRWARSYRSIPIWLYGPYDPEVAVNPAQPDWYIGWLEGALRLGTRLRSAPVRPHDSLAVLARRAAARRAFADALCLAVDRRALRRDRGAHQLLDHPREVPWRTALGVALFLFALWLDVRGQRRRAGPLRAPARYLAITFFYRIFCVVAPIAGFALAFALATRAARQRRRGSRRRRIRLRRNARGGFDEEPLP